MRGAGRPSSCLPMKGDRLMPNRTRHTPTRCLPAAALIALLALAGCTLPPPPLALPSLPALPQSPLPPAGSELGDEMAQRVEFDLGTSTATVTGTLPPGGEANYALAAGTGQTVTIETRGTVAPVAITVHGPGGASWSGTTPSAAGDTAVTAKFVAPALGRRRSTRPPSPSCPTPWRASPSPPAQA